VREVNRRCRSGGVLLRASEEDDALCRASVVCLHVMQPNRSQQPGVGDDVSRERGGTHPCASPSPKSALVAGWTPGAKHLRASMRMIPSKVRSSLSTLHSFTPLLHCLELAPRRLLHARVDPDRAPTAAYACATLPHPPTPPLVHWTSSSHLSPFAHLADSDC
jgi:hypothetical protein